MEAFLLVLTKVHLLIDSHEVINAINDDEELDLKIRYFGHFGDHEGFEKVI